MRYLVGYLLALFLTNSLALAQSNDSFRTITFRQVISGERDSNSQLAVNSWDNECHAVLSQLEQAVRDYPSLLRNPRMSCENHIESMGLVSTQFHSTVTIRVDVAREVEEHREQLTGSSITGISPRSYNFAFSRLHLTCANARQQLRGGTPPRVRILFSSCHTPEDIGGIISYQLSGIFEALVVPEPIAVQAVQTARQQRNPMPNPIPTRTSQDYSVSFPAREHPGI